MGSGEEISPSRSLRRKRHEDRDKDSSSPSSDESSDVDSNEEERRRRRRKKEKRQSKDHRKRRHKSEKKRKKKRQRSSSSSSEEDNDCESETERRKKRKLLKDAKKILKEAKRSEGQQQQQTFTKMKFDKITEDDYFLKSNEFAAWLKEERRIYFSSLTSEDARKLFVDFVDVWNDGRLADKYYEGIKVAPRSSHKWHIKSEDPAEKEENWERSRKLEKLEKKKYQKDHEVVMDELLPKATGKERLFEKKAIERQQKRERELSPEPMKESDMMGGGDSFKQMLARDRARREKRASAKAEAMHSKVSAAVERETAAMDQFRAIVSTAGGKITIPRRT